MVKPPSSEYSDGTDAKTAENRAKNNFCATGQPAPLTFVSFKNLQKKTDQKKAEGVNFGGNRELLSGAFYKTSDGDTIGEESLVRVAALVLKADHSNYRQKAEAVNRNHKAM